MMLPRKRRKSRPDGADNQCSSNKEGIPGNVTPEHRIQGSSVKESSMEDPFIVISDSEREEMKEENVVQKKRAQPLLDRRRISVKRRIAQMTEEEQLALAVKMSEQEANHINYSHEEEDELMRKAIEESLHCCRVSEPLNQVTVQKIDMNKDSPSVKEHMPTEEHAEEPPLSQCSALSGHSMTKSPMVMLKRLSQDIVDSSSVILSPNCRDPFSGKESGLPSSCLSSTSDFVDMSPVKRLALSPVFPKRSPCKLNLVPRKLFEVSSPSTVMMKEGIDDQCSHCSETSEQDSTPLLPSSFHSVVLSDEGSQQSDRVYDDTLCNGDSILLELTKGANLSISQSSAQSQKKQNDSTVQYYWGVPFCPKGEDPNAYTQVILCQLEVYQKSLKRAQRRLLHKMDFGEPVQMEAPPLQGIDQGKADSQEDSEELNDVHLRTQAESEEAVAEDSDKLVAQRVSIRRRNLLETPVNSTLEEKSPIPTQDELAPSGSQVLFAEDLAGESVGVAPEPVCESSASPTAETNARSPAVPSEDVKEDDEITVCPETQPSPAEATTDRNEVTVLALIHSPPQTSISCVPPPEEAESVEPGCPQDVECPLCGQHFHPSKIELHAAYCDGTSKSDKQDMTALRNRQKLTRKNFASPGDLLPSLESGKCEKCYLCKSLVPLREYQRHVDSCLQTAVLETQSSRRLRSTKENTGQEGRLLSMLEQSESMSAEASSNAPEPDYMSISPIREEQTASLDTLSDSPIRSFVSISEAKDCLVDFKQQFSRQPSSRGSRHTSRKKRRRF
ncbi:BRCA1-A complex subunit RAP80 [Rhinophrynus dorsalis]